jgi:hypothetical protein
VDDLMAKGQHLGVVMDSSLPSANKASHYYSKALADDVLIKSTEYPDLEHGILTQRDENNSTVVFVDWLNQKSKDVWGSGLRNLHYATKFDGVMYFDNEPSGLCDGECPTNTTSKPAYSSPFLEVETL